MLKSMSHPARFKNKMTYSLSTDLVEGKRPVNLIAGNILEYCDLSTRLIARNDLRSFGSLLIFAVRPVKTKNKKKLKISAHRVNETKVVELGKMVEINRYLHRTRT